MRRSFSVTILSIVLGLWCAPIAAQTSSAPGIDIEIYNPEDGSNFFCVIPSETFWIHVFLRPGEGSTSCDLPCGNGVPGGSANIAAGVIDLLFDPALFEIQQLESNPDPGFAAVDGLFHTTNLGEGRIGWALAGDWNIDGDPASGLKDPCVMQKLNSPGWLFRVQLTAVGEGATVVHLRNGNDHPPFPLSFADLCGSADFTLDGGAIDELLDALIVINPDCATMIFSDGFESGDSSAWSHTVP